MYICFFIYFLSCSKRQKNSICRYVALSLCRYLFVSRFYAVQFHECYLADFSLADADWVVFGIVATTEDTFFVVGCFEAFYHRASSESMT